MQVYAMQATNGYWTLYYSIGDTEKAYERQQFNSENAALLFAAMNGKLLK